MPFPFRNIIYKHAKNTTSIMRNVLIFGGIYYDYIIIYGDRINYVYISGECIFTGYITNSINTRFYIHVFIQR